MNIKGKKMEQELVLHKNGVSQGVQHTREGLGLTDEKIELIKRTVAKGATLDELQLFIHQCEKSGLDPLARQIYFMKRKVKDEWKMTIQTSIDGFRVIAERSGDYAGQDEPEFIENNGQLVCAKVKVYRFKGNIRFCAAVGVAYWNEYVPAPGLDFMWKKMPHTMLSKVAEALALRKAYPQDLSGIYTNDEMQQAERVDTTTGEISEPAIIESLPIVDLEDLRGKLTNLLNNEFIRENERIAALNNLNNYTVRELKEKVIIVQKSIDLRATNHQAEHSQEEVLMINEKQVAEFMRVANKEGWNPELWHHLLKEHYGIFPVERKNIPQNRFEEIIADLKNSAVKDQIQFALQLGEIPNESESK
jgi:phage recombination protein Bet